MPSERDLLIQTRRDLHRHPELGYQEHRTAGIVAERLGAAGYEVRTGIAETGVVGVLRGGGGDGPALLLRADMDALPVQEENTHDFVSTVPGRMHACGHDGHVAVGLAVAERLARRREEWGGEVHYLFQPAEEGGGGALRMIEEGVLEGVDGAMGLHLWAGIPSGCVGVIEGPIMAGSLDFRIVVRGRGGHGGVPNETVDATVAASHLVVALQTVVARNVSPLDTAVVTVGSFHAGTANNVIAGKATLDGTLRAFDPDVLARIRTRVAEVAEGVCRTFGAEHQLEWGKQVYPPTVNDPGVTGVVRAAAQEVLGEEGVWEHEGVRTMAAEDFSEFAARVPGCYFFVGARNEATGAVHPHHSPHFDLCEEALATGVDVLERAALRFLGGR